LCGAPAGKEPPFVADLATTTAANGKLEILQRKNKVAPVGLDTGLKKAIHLPMQMN
jgi:LDH2 family malate/lactate/ureidoglycolate dehydrogenase